MDNLAHEPTGPTGPTKTSEEVPLQTRDWTRGAAWVGAIVLGIILGWLAVLASMCGCTTRPA